MTVPQHNLSAEVSLRWKPNKNLGGLPWAVKKNLRNSRIHRSSLIYKPRALFMSRVVDISPPIFPLIVYPGLL